MNRFCGWAVCMAAVLVPVAAWADWSVTAESEASQGIYRDGAPASFTFLVKQDGTPAAAPLLCEIEREGGIRTERRKLASGADGRLALTVAPGKPGTVRVRATLLDAEGKAVMQKAAGDRTGRLKPVDCRIGAVMDPEKIDTALVEPADFDAFWDRARAELAAVPMKELACREMPLPEAQSKRFKLFDITLAAPGPRPVCGYLAVPADAKPKSLPAILQLHGAGVRSSLNPVWLAGYRAIAMDINAHGLKNGEPQAYYDEYNRGELKDYIYRPALDDPEKGYFKYMYLRALRALEYLRSRPEWDGRVLIVTGGSQGGAQALAVSGLDPQITFCRAYIPWLTAPAAPSEGRFQPGWPQLLKIGRDGKVANPEAIARLGYFDNANFAKRIKAECAFGYGLIDTICPPSGVWITYNRVPGRKTIWGAPTRGHEPLGGPDVIFDYLKRVRSASEGGL